MDPVDPNPIDNPDLPLDCQCNVCPHCGGCIWEKGELKMEGCEPCKCPELYCLKDGDFEEVIKRLKYLWCNQFRMSPEEIFVSGCTDEYNPGYKQIRIKHTDHDFLYDLYLEIKQCMSL